MLYIFSSVLIGIFLAEFLSGFFHWWEDRYGNPEWKILGPLIVIPNIEHHKNPSKFCSYSYWQRNNTTMIPSLILAGAFYWCLPVCFAFLILSQMNEIHSWAHKRSNAIIRFAQRLGILQSPKHHHIHHWRPYDKNFCIMTNYLNPVLRIIRFWEGLEWVVAKLLRVRPLAVREEY